MGFIAVLLIGFGWVMSRFCWLIGGIYCVFLIMAGQTFLYVAIVSVLTILGCFIVGLFIVLIGTLLAAGISD